MADSRLAGRAVWGWSWMTSVTEPTVESRLIAKGDVEYEQYRAGIWNRDVPVRYPEFILRVRSVRDVVDGLNLARERGWRVTVRGGGHNWFGTSLRDGGLLLDLGEMRELVSIDTDLREAVIEPALTGRDLARKLEPHGLAFPVGHCATVPLSGYLLNGGFGWNSLAWGPACFSVRSLDIVTPNGDVITASPEENSDWYWAARGGGHGFFGVVVRYRIGLFPLPKAITTSTCVFPLSRIREVSDWAAALRGGLPKHVELTVILGNVPGILTGGDARLSRAVVVTATSFSDGEEEARATLASLTEPPVDTGCQRKILNDATPYEALSGLGAELWPENFRYRSDNFWHNESLGTVLPRLAGPATEAPERSFFLCLPVPPPDPAVPPPDTAFSMIGPTFVACYAVWKDPKSDGAAKEWYARSTHTLETGSIGHYIGEADIELHPERARRSFSPAAWKRLDELRKRYDPSRRFSGFYGEP